MYENKGRLMTHVVKQSIMCLKPLMVLKFIGKRSQNKINNYLIKDILLYQLYLAILFLSVPLSILQVSV